MDNSAKLQKRKETGSKIRPMNRTGKVKYKCFIATQPFETIPKGKEMLIFYITLQNVTVFFIFTNEGLV